MPFPRNDVNVALKYFIAGGNFKFMSDLSFFWLSVKWTFCKIPWNLVFVITFWIALLPKNQSVDKHSSIQGSSLTAIMKFIPRRARTSSFVVAKFGSFWFAYLLVSAVIISIRLSSPAAVQNISNEVGKSDQQLLQLLLHIPTYKTFYFDFQFPGLIYFFHFCFLFCTTLLISGVFSTLFTCIETSAHWAQWARDIVATSVFVLDFHRDVDRLRIYIEVMSLYDIIFHHHIDVTVIT